jgi:hypothetical protein
MERATCSHVQTIRIYLDILLFKINYISRNNHVLVRVKILALI